MEIYKLYNPFKQIDLVSVVKLHPHQMNGDYYVHLKRNLEAKVIGKCNNDGMITEVLKLTSYDENEINPESFEGDADYRISYIATICVPIEGKAIILKVDKILLQYADFIIVGTNGYFRCVMPLSGNKKTLHMDKGQIIFTSLNKPIVKGDYIKVSIIHKRIEANDKTIGIKGSLLALATEDEVKHFYNSKDEDIVEEITEGSEEIIFSEDVGESNTSYV